LNTAWSNSSTNTKKGLSIVLIVPGTNEVFTPPYTYALDPAATLKELVINGAGAGKTVN
jgi:pectate lyase